MDTSVPIDTLVAYALAVAGIVSVILEIVKAIAIDPYFPDTPQRTATLRGLNYLMNFVLLVAILLGKNLFNGVDILTYLALAFGQSVGSHAVQQTFSGNGPLAAVAARVVRPKPGSAAMAVSDVAGDVAPPES